MPPYILCEDTVGGTLARTSILLTDQRAAPDFAESSTGRGYLYWGDSPWCGRWRVRTRHGVRMFPRETAS